MSLCYASNSIEPEIQHFFEILLLTVSVSDCSVCAFVWKQAGNAKGQCILYTNALTLHAVTEMAHVLSCVWTRSKRAGSASRQGGSGRGRAPFPRTMQGSLFRLRRRGHGQARAPFQTDDARGFECGEVLGRGYPT